MALQRTYGYERTLSVLKEADQGALVGLLNQALNEPDARFRGRTAAFLAQAATDGIDRLLVRRFNDLGDEARQLLLKQPEVVLRAARRLGAVDDGQIRANVVEALAALADRRSIPLMLRYVDDPSASVRDRARSLLHVLSRRYGTQLIAEGGKDRAYLRTAMGLVLRGGDVTREGLRTLLALGVDGYMLLLPFLRVGEGECYEKIVEHLKEETDRSVVECLFFLATSSIPAETSKPRTDAPPCAARTARVPVPTPISSTLQPGFTVSPTMRCLDRSDRPRLSQRMPRS